MEASVILPVFVAAAAVLFFFFQVMEVQWGVQRALEHTSRLFALTGCQDRHETLSGAVTVYMIQQLNKDKISLDIVPTGVAGMNYVASSSEGNYVDLKVHYTVEIPLKLFGRLKWKVTQQARNRKWVGYDPAENEEDGKYVYITPYGTVYHKNANCSYLNPSIQSLPMKALEQKRNKDGSRYIPCLECSDRENTSSIIYLTDYGTAWHRALNCSGLKRTVYRVPAESVREYAACDKCTG